MQDTKFKPIGRDEQDKVNMLNEAIKLFQDKKMDDALRIINKVESWAAQRFDNVSLSTLYYIKSTCLSNAENSDLQESLKYINKALQLHEDPLFYSTRAALEFQMGENEQAISDYNKALSMGAEHAYAYLGRGYVYEETKEWEKAAADFEKAISLGEASASTFYALGVVLGNTKEIDRAVAAFESAISLDPLNLDIYLDEIRTLLNAGRYEEAKRVVDSARSRKLDDPFLHLASATYLLSKGDYEGLSSELLSVTNPDPKFDSTAIELFIKAGDYIGVADIYKKWALAYPHIPGFYELEMAAIATYLEKVRILNQAISEQDGLEDSGEESKDLERKFDELLNDLSKKYLEAFDNLSEVGFPSLDYHSALEKLHKLEAEKASGFEAAEVFEQLARKYPHMPGPYKLLIKTMGDAIIKEKKPEYLEKFMRIKSKYEDPQEPSGGKLLDN